MQQQSAILRTTDCLCLSFSLSLPSSPLAIRIPLSQARLSPRPLLSFSLSFNLRRRRRVLDIDSWPRRFFSLRGVQWYKVAVNSKMVWQEQRAVSDRTSLFNFLHLCEIFCIVFLSPCRIRSSASKADGLHSGREQEEATRGILASQKCSLKARSRYLADGLHQFTALF